MRNEFEIKFSNGHPLRRLASAIATYQCDLAKSDGFFSAKPPPYNFLANGETDDYKPLKSVRCPLEIAEWKFPVEKINCCLAQGFHQNSPSTKGLAMLFDPLVDAALYANIGTKHSTQPASTVIVLSDYGAIYDIDLIDYLGKDWGEDEAGKILHPPTPISRKQVSNTLINLWDCLCEDKPWRKHTEHIENAIHDKNILIWNFMPLMRGGSASANNLALPDKKFKGWLQACINWLGDFVEIVEASKVVLCVNKTMLIPIKSSGQVPIPISSFKTDLPGISLGKLGRFANDNRIFALNHPTSPAFVQSNNCSDLREMTETRPFDVLNHSPDS